MLKIKTEKSDVLIIGSGGAGLRAAIELHDNKAKVLVVGKSKKRDAHTIQATGGINAALGNMDKKDSWELHAADTIRDGGFLNDSNAVILLCKNAHSAVKELAKWGTKFHRETNGKITQRFFGAATYRRACFIGDETGKAILNTLVNQVEKRKIRFKSETYIFSLLKSKGKVNGALGLDLNSGEIIKFQSKIVVLATGGHSRMFGRSSSRFWENNGDGIYLAKKAGARFMDMELFQFHPTGMVYPPKASGILVTEAVRGEGGILTNSKGERFMEKYDPERMELSARDIVARANFMEIRGGKGTKHNGVWLDISHKPKSYIQKRLPKMYKQFKEYANIDISKQKMEVAPTAHYSMGGVLIDHKTGKTDVKNLFAIGEVTSGVHGGNRLGGNSLAEITVFGKLTGQSILKELKKIKQTPLDDSLVEKEQTTFFKLTKSKKGKNPIKAKEELQKMMWKYLGVIRNEKGMKTALKQLEKFKKMKLKVMGSLKMNEQLIAALDFQNMLPTCEMIIKSAIFRKESRAAHYRSDYKKTNPKWKKNIICTIKKGKVKLSTRTVPKPPKKIQKLVINPPKPQSKKLLE
ncbi:FAD-binding protein [archaeon]|nr:FAD-binding protein [archaeon]